MRKIRKQCKNFINFGKDLAGFSSLRASEKNGKFCWDTKIRLAPRTAVELPFHLGRSIRGLSFTGNLKGDTFAKIVALVLQKADKRFVIEQLSEAYMQESKMNAAEIIGPCAPNFFSEYPAWALVMPWEKMGLRDRFTSYPKIITQNRGMHGLQFDDTITSYSYESVYSYEAAQSQVEQTDALARSIKRHGVIKSANLPLVYILRNGLQWRWCMTGEGNHRAYICALNGDYNFFAEVFGIVDRARVNKWPNVLNGDYSEKEALTIFDYFFSGKKCIRGLV